MSELPQGWAITTIRDVTLPYETAQPTKEPNKDFQYIDIGSIDNTTQTITTPKNFLGVDAPSRARRVVKKNDILFSTVRTYLKNIARVPAELDGVLTSTGIAVLRADPEIDSNFLFYCVVSEQFIREISSTMDGTLYPAVTDSDVAAAQIPLPPLNEQRRIVAKIEALMARSQRVKEALEAIPPLLDQFRQSVLAAAFRGDLTAEWREKNPDVEPASALLERILTERRRRWEEEVRRRGREPQQANYKEPKPVAAEGLPDLPNKWIWARVEEVGRVQLGRQRSPKNHSGSYMRPYLRAANVFEDRIDISDVLEMNFDPQEYETFKLKAGDILLNEGQSKELVGRPAIYRGEVPSSCFQNTLVRLQAYNGLLPEYALIVFRGYMRSGRFQKIAQWTTNIAHLGAGRFAEIEFPLPPEAEQQEIVNRVKDQFASISNFESVFNAAIGELNQLDQSILAKAFRGELVPQDPNDEPASVLLERIRAEREKADKTKKANGKGIGKGSRKAKAEVAASEQLSMPGLE